MKKLLAIIGSISIFLPIISSITSCGIKATQVKTLIDERNINEYKVNNNAVDFEKMFGNKTILKVLSMQILEALTFTKDKYQNSYDKQKERLGKKGWSLSLDLKTIPIEDRDESIIIENNTGENFIEDYKASNNNRFDSINWNLGITNKQISENDKWVASNATVISIEDIKVLEANIRLNNKNEPTNISKSNNTLDSLGKYLTLKWKEVKDQFNKIPSDLQGKYAEDPIYNMDEDRAKEMFKNIKNKDPNNELIKNIKDENNFKIYHSQFNKYKNKYKNGIILPGKFDKVYKNAQLINDFGEGKIDKEWNLSDGIKFFTKENKYFQTQELNKAEKDNNGKTYVYAKSEKPINLNFKFKSNNKEYEINLTINNVFSSYQLTATTLNYEKVSESESKKTLLYWYEPIFYQFTKKEMFRTNTKSDKFDGTKDVFEHLEGAKIVINMI